MKRVFPTTTHPECIVRVEFCHRPHENVVPNEITRSTSLSYERVARRAIIVTSTSVPLVQMNLGRQKVRNRFQTLRFLACLPPPSEKNTKLEWTGERGTEGVE